MCAKCCKQRETKNFNKNVSKADGLQPYCRECQNNVDRTLYGSSALRRQKVRQRSLAKRAELHAITVKVKLERGCYCCPERTPECLKFHHLDPKMKDLEVSKAVQFEWSVPRLLREIEKCVVVCGNCHDKLHAGLLQLKE